MSVCDTSRVHQQLIRERERDYLRDHLRVLKDRRLKAAAMLSLSMAGWPLIDIGRLFDRNNGTVCRVIQNEAERMKMEAKLKRIDFAKPGEPLKKIGGMWFALSDWLLLRRESNRVGVSIPTVIKKLIQPGLRELLENVEA